MSAKKFPTPNWAKIVEQNNLVPVALYEAVQTDIALAVEAARVTVPENIRRYLLAVTAPPSAQSEAPDDRPPILKASHAWLESLTVAPKDAKCEP